MQGNAGSSLASAAEPGGIMLTDFYISFSALCFTLLGLWLVVVQAHLAEWAVYRRRSYGIALHFSLPGMMSLLALVDSQSSLLWRASFAIVALGGAAVLLAVRGPAPDRLGLAAYGAAVVLYLVIGIVAVAPHIVTGAGLAVAPVRVEAVLLCVLVFLGVNVAWLMLFDMAPKAAADRPADSQLSAGP